MNEKNISKEEFGPTTDFSFWLLLLLQHAWGVEETTEERPYPLAKSSQVRREPCDVSGLILAREEAEAQRVLGTCQ